MEAKAKEMAKIKNADRQTTCQKWRTHERIAANGTIAVRAY